MALSTRSQAGVVEKVHEEMEEIYPNYDKTTMAEVARIYMDCVDKKGFVFDFDDAWQWAGYSSKKHAKDKLIGVRGKLGLTEGVDYIVGKKNSIRAAGEAPSSTENLICATALAKHEGAKHGGDRKSEKIMLTSRALNQFALSADTLQGTCLRDVVLATSRLMKQFMNEVQSGRIRIVRTDQGDKRGAKRLKVCDTQKALMQEVVSKDPSFGNLCGRINGETNKATTGRYKYETARLLGKKSKDVNSRDYMTPTQLAAAELIEMLSTEEIASSDKNPFDIHSEVANKVMHSIRDKVHGHIASEPMNLRTARMAPALEDKPTPVASVTNANTINNYFISK